MKGSTAMQNDLPNNDAWVSRFKTLRDWHGVHGSLPKSSPAGGPEDTLWAWLNRQRVAIATGTLDPNLAKILAMVPGAVASPDTGIPSVVQGPLPGSAKHGMSRLQRLEEFFAERGRLPKSGADEAEEKALYKYINSIVRVRYRRGELPVDTVERLGAMPGVLVNIRTRPEALPAPGPTAAARRVARRAARIEARLDAMVEFLTESKRLPTLGNPQPEPMLRAYFYGTLRPAYAAGRLDAETVSRLNAALPGCLIPKNRAKAGTLRLAA